MATRTADSPARWQAKLALPPCTLGVRIADDAVEEIEFLPASEAPLPARDALAREVCRQLQAYAQDPRFRFSLPLASAGTLFQRRVWQCIAEIPPGETRSYGELSLRLKTAPRAVGQACGANPFPLVIPCHRVVSAAGLGGFAHHAGGFHLRVKRWLLEHEQKAG
jgi:methylated-DNA-[protein]-cysteine S-methyltransferase